MIAPRKKKFIKLFLMAWSVVLVITGSALPVLAASPLPTDDTGNWLPSSFYASWLIYNTSTQSYQNVSVTSSVTRDGLSFDFPTNLYGVAKITLLLYTGSSSTYTSYYADSFYISGYLTYTNQSGLFNVNLGSSSYLRSLYYSDQSSSTPVVNLTSYFSSNPFVISSSDPLTFNRLSFVFDFPNAGTVSGTFNLTFTDFVFGGVDVKDRIYISQLEDSTEELDDSLEALETALPLPTFDASAFASAEAIADDYTFFNDGLRFSFMESDLVTHIFILVVYFTCLSIAIFGHAGG